MYKHEEQQCDRMGSWYNTTLATDNHAFVQVTLPKDKSGWQYDSCAKKTCPNHSYEIMHLNACTVNRQSHPKEKF